MLLVKHISQFLETEMNIKKQTALKNTHAFMAQIIDQIEPNESHHVNKSFIKSGNLSTLSTKRAFYRLANRAGKKIQIMSNKTNLNEFFILCVN